MSGIQHTYETLMEKRRKLLSAAATANSIALNNDNKYQDLSSKLAAKIADVQMIREQIEFMKRPRLVASLGAWRDLWAELELYETQAQKLSADVNLALHEFKKQTRITATVLAEIRDIDVLVNRYGKLLWLP